MQAPTTPDGNPIVAPMQAAHATPTVTTRAAAQTPAKIASAHALTFCHRLFEGDDLFGTFSGLSGICPHRDEDRSHDGNARGCYEHQAPA